MLSNKLQRKIIRLALASFDLPIAGKKHFSFITNKNKIVAFGYNKSYKTHTISNRYGHRFNDIHAELDAILDFPYSPRELQDYVLVNIRLRKDKSIAISKPCIYCTQLLEDLHVREIFYTTNSGYFEQL